MSKVEENIVLVERVRKLYNTNVISREAAKSMLADFIDAHNKKAIEVAKKHKVRPKFINFSSLVR